MTQIGMEGQMQENNANLFQLPPPKFDEQLPISYPTQQQEYQQYIPPEPYIPPEAIRQQEPFRNNYEQPPPVNLRENRSNQQYPPPIAQASPLKNPIKQQQDEYREILKKQMEEKEYEKKRKRDDGPQQQQFQQPIFSQQSNNSAPLPPQPINRQKQEYGDFLRQQMQEKEESKKRRAQSGNNNQQQQLQQQQYQPQQQFYQDQPPEQQYQPQVFSQQSYQQSAPMQQQQVNPQKIQKQEYGDYLRMQMQIKEAEKNDRKKSLQQKMETGDSFPFGKGGGGAPNIKQPQQNIPNQSYPQQQYNQPVPQQQYYQQPQQPQQLQVQQQQYQQPFQQQNIVPPYQQNSYQEQLPLDFDQQPYLADPQGPPVPIKAGRNRLMMENANMDDVRKKEQQKLEMQRVLQEQIEEKKRKKEQERLQKEKEDRLEEERFRREKEQEEFEKKREEDMKKQQQGKFENDNVDLREKKRLERMQERKNRKNQMEDQPQQNNELFDQQQPPFQEPSQRNLPPSQPKSENYLKDFLLNEKMKEGVSPQQSIVDFYRNGPGQRNKQDVQQNREIDDIKKQMYQQQENLQQQIQQVMSQAQMAIEGRNKAEQELISLKEQVKNKYLQEERHHDDLMVALVKNDPKWEKQVFPPHLLAQAEIREYKDLSMPDLKENFNFPNSNSVQPFQPSYQSKPLVLKEESIEQKLQFREQFGLQSLVSDSNMVPIDANASLVPQPAPMNKRNAEPQLDKIDELNAHFEDTMKLGVGEPIHYKNDPFQKRPSSNSGQHPSWNVPSIDSEFVREIDDLLKYKPAQQTINRPPSGLTKAGTQQQQQMLLTNSNRPPSQTYQRPPSTFGKAAKGVLGSNDMNYKGITLDSEFPDLTMAKRNADTLDIAGVHKRMDQKLMHLNEFEEDEDLQKLDKLLYQYNS